MVVQKPVLLLLLVPTEMITKFFAHVAFEFLFMFESRIKDKKESEQIIVVLDILRKYM